MSHVSDQPKISPGKSLRLSKHFLFAGAAFLALTVAMFGDVLFTTSQDVVLSGQTADVFSQFLAWRKFGFGEMRHGNFPLWNPHVFGGAPYFGGFQSALLYPLNALFLFLPVNTAINYSIALHVFLAGLFMYFWASHRRLHPLASFFSGMLWMFCGPYFFHIEAGHLTNLCTVVWAPLIFLAIDGLLEKPAPGWWLLGSFAVAMQILAGHPQYLFYTAVAATLYTAFNIVKAPQRGRTAMALVAMCGVALGVAAVQVLAGVQASGECIRSIGVPRSFAAMFSFPPENLLTLLAPGIFGFNNYWGRCSMPEMELFIGVVGISLAIWGILRGPQKQTRLALMMALVTLLIALGRHTVLFTLLYDYVPGFNKFRGFSKFIFITALFLAMLAGYGMDDLIRFKKVQRHFILALVGVALVAAGFAIAINVSASDPSPTAFWKSLIGNASDADERLRLIIPRDPAFIAESSTDVVRSLSIASATLMTLAVLLWMVKRWPAAVFAIVVIATGEMFTVARIARVTGSISKTFPDKFGQYFSEDDGDYRLAAPLNPNMAMYYGLDDIWGNDPCLPLRYGQFIAWTQHVNPDKATQQMSFTGLHPMLKILRRGYNVGLRNGNYTVVKQTDRLHRLELIQRYRVLPSRNEIFNAMGQEQFDPAREVLLESTPVPEPIVGDREGAAKVVKFSTDYMDIEADVPTPAILLVTDTYTPNWRARALPGSSQERYDLVPANYCLRAVPLGAGHHILRIEYAPTLFVVGKWISLTDLVAYLAVFGWWLYRWNNWHRSVSRNAC